LIQRLLGGVLFSSPMSLLYSRRASPHDSRSTFNSVRLCAYAIQIYPAGIAYGKVTIANWRSGCRARRVLTRFKRRKPLYLLSRSWLARLLQWPPLRAFPPRKDKHLACLGRRVGFCLRSPPQACLRFVAYLLLASRYLPASSLQLSILHWSDSPCYVGRDTFFAV
jgi:hypothetical protein